MNDTTRPHDRDDRVERHLPWEMLRDRLRARGAQLAARETALAERAGTRWWLLAAVPSGVTTVAVLALILTGSAVARQNVVIWLVVISAGGTFSVLVRINHMLHRKARKAHARQESARLEYESVSLPSATESHLASARVEKLLERVDRQERLIVQQLLRNVFLAFILGLPVFGVVVTLAIEDAAIPGSIATGLLVMLAAIGFIFARNRARELESAVQQTDYELNLLSPHPKIDQRAELLYLKQQFELKRYYDEALRQSTTLSYIGAACVLGGFVVIGVTFALLNDPDAKDSTALAIVGGVGGFLANFVAVVFLKMHSETIRALTKFQSRLVDTNHLHFANLLLSRIDSEGVSARHAEALTAFLRATAASQSLAAKSDKEE